jgi:hypothetical protein
MSFGFVKFLENLLNKKIHNLSFFESKTFFYKMADTFNIEQTHFWKKNSFGPPGKMIEMINTDLGQRLNAILNVVVN